MTLPPIDRTARAVGIAWFRQEDYPALLQIFADADELGSWEEWHEAAQTAEKAIERDGVIAVRAYIDPDTFAAWCAARNVDPGAEGRSLFASEIAAKRYGRHRDQ